MRWLVFVLVCGGCRCAWPPVMTVTSEVRVEPSMLDFGEVYLGRRGQKAVVLTNTGRSAKTVSVSIEGPFSASPTVEVAGGESVEVSVTFEPTTAGPSRGVLSVMGAALANLTLTGLGLEVPACAAVPACQATTFDFDRRECVTASQPDGTACTSACLRSAACVSGECRGAVSATCDDGNACTIDACGADGACLNLALECPVTDSCTVAYCDPSTGCQTRPVDDGTACGEETCRQALVCINGQCVSRQRPGAADECTPVDLAASRASSCVLTRAGSVRCWGAGHATPGNVFSRPAVLRRAARATTLSMAGATCNALETGSFQCGDGLWPPADGGTVRAVVGNVTGACWLDVDGGVDCESSEPTPPRDVGVRSLAADVSSFCGHADDGGVVCWGYLPDLLLFDGGREGVAVFHSALPARAVRRGYPGTCVLHDQGADCWPRRSLRAGQAPSTTRLEGVIDVAVPYDGNTELLPVLRDGGVLRCRFEADAGLSCAAHDAGLPPVKKAAAGAEHACFLTQSDEVACAGSNSLAQLSDLSPALPSPAAVPRLSLELVTFGVSKVAGVLRDGGVVEWGAGVAQPTFVPLPARGAKSLASVPDGTCALQTDGGVDCWDGALHHVTGLPPLKSFASPCAFGAGAPLVGLTSAGDPCWFRASGSSAGCSAFVEVPGACGWLDSRCSVRTDGGVVCDGTNRYGQLGTGDLVERNRPTAVALPAPALKLAMSHSQACALLSSGQVLCWGLEPGTSRPVPPTPLTRVLPFARELVCGVSHCCVLVGSNGVSCWGSNLFNELGREGPHSHVPVPLALPGRVVQLVASSSTTCALLADGALWCWGDNRQAQRGVTPLLSSSVPIFVR